MHAPTQPMIVYDRKCMLCSTSMAFVIRHDRQHLFRLVPAQSALGRAAYLDHGLDPDALATMIVVADGRARTESDAALYVLAALGWPWRAAAAARVVPGFVRNGVYRWVARNRYRWFGTRHACVLPNDPADR
jgi:predicted DCC family thiol-disulfide oxidoreductase YuxK